MIKNQMTRSEVKKSEVVARYVTKGLNPFRLRVGEGDFGRKVCMVEDSMSNEDITRFAQEEAPRGYELLTLTRKGKEIYTRRDPK